MEFAFPPIVTPGRNTVTLYGRNLPGGTPSKELGADGKLLEKASVTVDVPADPAAWTQLSRSRLQRPAESVVDGYDFQWVSPAGPANPIFLEGCPGPVIVEAEPNNASAQAQKVAAPCDIAGRFFASDDADYYRFDARKGEVFWIEAFSQRLGLATDPFLVCQRLQKNDKGEETRVDVAEAYDQELNVGGFEFNTGTRDPAIRLEVKEDGAYQVQLRDLFKRQSVAAKTYRLSIRRESPDFRLAAFPQTPIPVRKDQREALVWTVFARRGESRSPACWR